MRSQKKEGSTNIVNKFDDNLALNTTMGSKVLTITGDDECSDTTSIIQIQTYGIDIIFY